MLFKTSDTSTNVLARAICVLLVAAYLGLSFGLSLAAVAPVAALEATDRMRTSNGARTPPLREGSLTPVE